MLPPYIEISQGNSYEWQAMIAWHINIPTHEDWLASRWGFNAGALLDEALDRLKLFIGSFHNIDPYTQSEPRFPKTLAIRCLNIPGEGLQLGLVGKIFSPTSDNALSNAIQLCREIESIFPLDFSIVRATTKDIFSQITGEQLFDINNDSTNILQIKRAEVFSNTLNNSNFLSGFWHANLRSSEQIWRALAAMPNPVLLNITLCPTLLFENEQRLLWELKDKVENITIDQNQYDPLHLLLPWYKSYVTRRLSPWNKFYYLQVHIIAKESLGEFLAQSIGSALTYNDNQSMPSFSIEAPKSSDESQEWINHLHLLEIIPSAIRLQDLADLDESYSAFRLPYLSATGLSNVKFLTRSMD